MRNDMPLLESLNQLVNRFMSVSLGVRILLGTIMGALGSSTLIGFLAELGAVNYALAYGARLPTEGVPYLRYAATAISLSIFVIAFAVLVILNITVIGAVRQFLMMSPMDGQADAASMASIPIKRYILKGALPAFAATQGLTQLFYFTVPSKTLPQWTYFAFSLFATVLILLLARKPAWVKKLILLAFTVCVGAFFVAAFTPSLYGLALNYARQGGGVQIRLDLSCENRSQCAPYVEGKLFLRTTDSFLLRDEKTLEYREIPSRLVESVRYGGEERWGAK